MIKTNNLNMKKPKQITYFISGHSDVTVEEFYKYYRPKILKGISENANFIMGDFIGVDTMAIEFLYNFIKNDPNSNFSAQQVTIYHKNENPECNIFNFKTKGGFKGIKDRDIAMTKDSTHDILWIRKGKENSHTAKNKLRRLDYDKNKEIIKS